MKLDQEQIEARYEMYSECIAHLKQDVTETAAERLQANFLIDHLTKIRDSWYKLIMSTRTKPFKEGIAK